MSAQAPAVFSLFFAGPSLSIFPRVSLPPLLIFLPSIHLVRFCPILHFLRPSPKRRLVHPCLTCGIFRRQLADASSQRDQAKLPCWLHPVYHLLLRVLLENDSCHCVCCPPLGCNRHGHWRRCSRIGGNGCRTTVQIRRGRYRCFILLVFCLLVRREIYFAGVVCFVFVLLIKSLSIKTGLRC